jgi:hypothetical protein
VQYIVQLLIDNMQFILLHPDMYFIYFFIPLKRVNILPLNVLNNNILKSSLFFLSKYYYSLLSIMSIIKHLLLMDLEKFSRLCVCVYHFLRYYGTCLHITRIFYYYSYDCSKEYLDLV